MNRVKIFTILNALSLIIHVSTAYLTQFKLINPVDVGQIADQYDSLFTPAGITFAIWGVIYTVLGVLCLYHIIMAYKHSIKHPANEDVRRMGGLFIFNNLITSAWLLAWTNNMMLISLLLIIVQLLTLIGIHLRLGILDRSRESGSIICTQFPLSVYFGWISLATIANTSIYLVSVNWKGGGISPVYWTIIMIAVAALLAILMIIKKKNVWFGLVIAWGIYGIILKRETMNLALYQPIVQACWCAIFVILLIALIQTIQNFRYRARMPIFPEAKSSLK